MIAPAFNFASMLITLFLFLSASAPLSAEPTPYTIGNLKVFETCGDLQKAPKEIASIYAKIQLQAPSQEQKRSLIVFNSEVPLEFHVVGAPVLGVIENRIEMILQGYAFIDGRTCHRVFYSADLASEEAMRIKALRPPIEVPQEAIRMMESHARYCAPFYGTPRADTIYCFLPMSQRLDRSYTLENDRMQSGKVRLLQFAVELGNRTYIVTTIDEYVHIREAS